MLVGFYFPELSLAVEALEASRNKFGATLAEGITANAKPRRSNKELFDEINARYDDVDQASQKLLTAIATTARKQIKL
jgi:hypothetical protein